jgi:hypothetical protein
MIVYDGRDYIDRPKPLNWIECRGDNLWLNPGTPMVERKLDMTTVTNLMRSADESNVPALFNLLEESWDVPAKEFKARLKWWDAIWAQIRSVNPSQKVGCYAEVPARNFDDPVVEYANKFEPSQDHANQWAVHKPLLKKWKLLNNRLSLVADCVDVICPSLYLHYSKYKNEYWAAYAAANIEEAKQYGKQVFAWVCPRYFGEPPFDRPPVIELGRWKQFLGDVAKCKPDGIILWDYYEYGPFAEVADHFKAASALTEVAA